MARDTQKAVGLGKSTGGRPSTPRGSRRRYAAGASRRQSGVYRERNQAANAQKQAFLRLLMKQAGEAGGVSAEEGGGGGGGYGGGGGGFAGPDAGAVERDLWTQSAAVNQITADQAAKIKALQDQYAQATAAAQKGITSDTAAVAATFNPIAKQAQGDLKAQGFDAAPAQQAMQIEQQAMRDAANRSKVFAGQLGMAQNANFTDRLQGIEAAKQAYLADLQMQKTQALGAGGGGGSGGGGGGYGGGGGGGGSDSSWKDDMNAARQWNLAQDVASNMSWGNYGKAFLRNNVPGRNQKLLQSVRRDLMRNPGSDYAVLGRLNPKKHTRARDYVKGYQKARDRKRKANQRQLRGVYKRISSGY